MLRIAPRLMVLLLCGSALAGCAASKPDIAQATGGQTAASQARKTADAAMKTTPTDLESGVAQARTLRTGGHYDEAIHILSQLMLVASDDPRVVGEYGKTLAEKGRAQEAVDFLKRGTELSPNDWTLYSALGVSYDQLGNQTAAQAAYEHALALRPAEPSVLNNYALSRMLANDPDGARKLIGRAKIAGGDSDPKIARNIALLDKLAPAPAAPQDLAYAVQKAAPANTSAPAPMHATANAAPRSLPPMAQQPQQPMAQNMPRPQSFTPAPQMASNAVVMQAVPFDPKAGPVPAKAASHAPRPLVIGDAKPPVKTADAKPAEAKPAPVKIADAKPAPAAAKPAPVKTAAAQPAPAKSPLVKAAAKNQVPALRMAADMRSP